MNDTFGKEQVAQTVLSLAFIINISTILFTFCRVAKVIILKLNPQFIILIKNLLRLPIDLLNEVGALLHCILVSRLHFTGPTSVHTLYLTSLLLMPN